MRNSLPFIAVIVTMIIWGSTFVVTKAAASEIAPVTLAFLRFAVAAFVLVPLMLAQGGLERLPRPMPVAVLILMAFTGMALFTIAFNYALIDASATQGALIYAALPAAIALAAVFYLGERLTIRRMAGVLISVLGVALVIMNGEHEAAAPQPLVGALWMLGTVLAWTVYTVIAKRVEHLDQLTVITCVTLLSVAMLLPAMAWEMAQHPWTLPSLQAWLGVVFLGTAASALAYIAYGYALRHLEASVVGVFTNLDPIVGVVTAVVVLGEPLHTGQVLGGVVALTGMWLASTTSAPARTPAAAGDDESPPRTQSRS